jgi:N-acylglucosamine 2-epimerase
MNTTEYLQTWSDSYKNDMISNIMPFWMKYGWDRKNGGVYTCVDRDGQLMDTTKSVWFQGRFAFHVHMHIITLSVILNGWQLRKALSIS